MELVGAVEVGQAPRSDALAVFASRQPLLASTLARLLSRYDSRWAVEVLRLDHPDLHADCRRLRPRVVVLDVDIQVIPGIELAAHLANQIPAAAVLLLGEFDGRSTADALHRGIRGVITYSATPQQVVAAVAALASGRTSVSASALSGLVGGRVVAPAPAANGHLLSRRELDVLRQLVAGAPTEVIAVELGVSTHTVRKHTQHILGKLGVHSKLQAGAVAARDGLV